MIGPAIAPSRPGRGPGALGEHVAQPAVALGGLAGAALAPGAAALIAERGPLEVNEFQYCCSEVTVEGPLGSFVGCSSCTSAAMAETCG